MTSSPLEQRDNPTSWRTLLDKALPALDYVFGDRHRACDERGAPLWTLGGGTALALRIGHRLSDDIDIFVPTRPLKLFAPHHNPAAKAISPLYQWPGHYLKLQCAEGEIDFLSAHLQTEPGYSLEHFRDREVALETLAEVIVKKVRYRSGAFTARDIFDLAAVGRVEARLPSILAREAADALPRLRAVIAERSRSRPALGPEIRPTMAFEDLRAKAYVEADAILVAALSAKPG